MFILNYNVLFYNKKDDETYMNHNNAIYNTFKRSS